MAINQISLLDSIIPNVYFNKITLMTSGHVTNESNPHIDSEREPDIIRNPITGKLEREILTPDLVKKSQEMELLTITVDLIIQERLDKSGIATWFNNQDFMKYLKVEVFQSTSQDTTISLLKSKNMVTQLNRLGKFGESQTIKIKDIIGKTLLNEVISTTDNDGNIIYDISLQTKFYVKNANPEHLTYFAVSYLDVDEMAKDYGMDLGNDDFKTLEGKPASELVIDAYQIVSETYIFLDDKGAVWTGPVHQLPTQQWKSGEEEKIDSINLSLKMIDNTKVQDFRTYKEIEKLQLDFSIIENSLFSPSGRMDFKNNVSFDSAAKKMNASEIVLTRDTDHNCRFQFGINYLQLLRENSYFGNLYREDNAELFRNARIRTLKISRVRVKDNTSSIVYNDLTQPSLEEGGLENEDGVVLFNENDPYETVISSGETSPGVFKTSETDIGAVKELKLCLENDTGIRHFTGIDKKMSEITYGFYKYCVEIDIEDDTINYLSTKIDDLLVQYNILNQYLNDSIYGDNFDVDSNRFTKKYIDQQERKYGNSPNAPWISPIYTYLAVLDTVTEGVDTDRFSKSLYSYINPITGNPQGIMMVLSLIESLSSKLSDSIGSSVGSTVKKWMPGQSTTSPSYALTRTGNPSKTISVKVFSSTAYEVDVPLETGYDYLTIEKTTKEPNKVGLMTMPNVHYEKRAEAETLKYFKSTDVDVNIQTPTQVYTKNDNLKNNRLSFLTPSSIKLGGYVDPILTVNQGNNLFEPSKYLLASSMIAGANNLKHSPRQPLKIVTIPPQTLVGAGAISAQVGNTLVDVASQGAYSVIPDKFSKDYFGATAPFAIAPLPSGINAGLNGISLPPGTVSMNGKGTGIGRTTTSGGGNTRNTAGTRTTTTSTNTSTRTAPPATITSAIDRFSAAATGGGIDLSRINLVNTPQSRLARNIVVRSSPIQAAAKSQAPYSTISTSGIISPFFKNSDIIEKEYTECSSIGTKTPSTSTPLMIALTSPLLNSGLDSPLVPKAQELARARNTNTIQAYNLNYSKNIIDSKEYRMTAADRNTLSTTSISSQRKQEDILKLPNQIKSLLVDSVSTGKVKTSWINSTTTADPLRDPTHVMMFKINYHTINKIEVLSGYDSSNGQSKQMRQPIWKTLDEKEFERTKNSNVMCRMVSYVNKDFGIEKSKSIELPTYNEHFVLTPETGEIIQECPEFVSKGQTISDKLVNLHSQRSTFDITYASSILKSAVANVDFSNSTNTRLGISINTRTR